VLQPKEYHIALKDLQISHISLYRHYIGLAKARQRNFTKNLLDQLKLVVDYVMAYKIRDISELKQVTFLTTRTSTGSKIDVFHQSQPLTQSSDVTHAVRVVKNVTCLSSLLL
jgi:hypothetical protein